MTSFSVILALALGVLAFRLAMEMKHAGFLPMGRSAIQMNTNSPQGFESTTQFYPVKARYSIL